MVLNKGNITHLKYVLFGLAILCLIYLIVSLFHLVYFITDPDGFGGLHIFLETLIFVYGILLFILIFLNYFFKFLKDIYLDSSVIFKGKSVFFSIFGAFAFFLIYQFRFVVSSEKIANKYSLLNVSEKLIDEGEYRLALNLAEEAYIRYNNQLFINDIFPLSKLYINSQFGEKLAISKQYNSIINYAYCLIQNNRDLGLAEKLLFRAIELSKKKYLRNDVGNLIYPYFSLANFYLNSGNYIQADYYSDKLLNLISEVSETDLNYIIAFQESYASYNTSIGNIEKARELREINLKIFEENYPELTDVPYLNLLLLAASSELANNEYSKAGEYLLKAQPIAVKRKKKSIYLTYLNLKGIYCSYFSKVKNGQLELTNQTWISKIKLVFNKSSDSFSNFKSEAEACFEEYLTLERDKNGEQSIGYLQGLKRILIFYNDNGENVKAKAIADKLKKNIKSFKNTNKNLYYDALLNITLLDFQHHGYNTIIDRLTELEDYHFKTLTARYIFLTEREKESYKNIIDKAVYEINEIYALSNYQEAAGRIYNNLLSTKQIALYANENTRENLLLADKATRNEYYELLGQRDSLENSRNVENNSRILSKEKAIQVKLRSINSYQPFNPQSVNWLDIQNSLESRQAAIEFFTIGNGADKQYYALLIDKSCKYPKLIPLFKEVVMKNLLDQKGSLKERVELVYNKNLNKLYSLIWADLDKELQNVNKVYISLSGLLHVISFPTLIQNKKYDVLLVGSTRQVLNTKIENSINSFALIGDVEYGRINTKLKKPTRAYFENLPYTIYEIENIKSIIREFNPNIKVKVLTKSDASEKEFYKLGNLKPTVIHLATHGFFYKKENNYLNSSLIEVNNNNPMLRSGIILGGANSNSYQIKNNDGFLSAQEIAQQNFSNLDLAVLSACETGLGEEIGSEGIFGLQRAFKLAGARSLIMSLWKVPDKETSELMAYFYENLLIKGMTKSKSLHEAQLKMKSKKETNSPFYWGGFILLDQ
ncbi:MAG: CHAT domain-containing protein [Leadbetterella sp.]|nr:CHAT domain-containing protein [Leadbetterella sp.]